MKNSYFFSREGEDAKAFDDFRKLAFPRQEDGSGEV